MYKYVIRWKKDNTYLKEVAPTWWTKDIYDARSFSSLEEVESYLTGPDGRKYWAGEIRDFLSFDEMNPLNLIKV